MAKVSGLTSWPKRWMSAWGLMPGRLIHLGLAVEVLEDVRGGGVADEGLEALFKSA